MRRDIPAFIAFLDSRHSMPHAWGSEANDCISFADGAIIAQTGQSALRDLTWSSKREALSLLKQLGGLTAALDARFERIGQAHAHRGDIAGVPIERMIGLDPGEVALIGLHPMVIEGMLLSSPGARGLERAPRMMATVAWNIMARKTP
jgi:hypothetical protein